MIDASTSPLRRARVVAHRGAHRFAADGPYENSMAAFRRGIQLGVDVLELDVRRTRDGVLVVHHDPDLPDGRAIADLDHAQLPALPDGQPMATLREVARLAGLHGARLQVELKEAGYERDVVAELRANMPLRNAELISFQRSSIRALEAIDPALTTGALSPPLPEWLRATPLYPALVRLMDGLGWHPALNGVRKLGSDYVTVEQRLATPEFLADARTRGVDVDVWTVDDESAMRRLIAGGARSIVTNEPELALALRLRGV